MPADAWASAVTDLEPGNVYVIEPEDSECFSTSHVDPDEVDTAPLFCPIRAGDDCTSAGQASLFVTSCVTERAVSGGAHAHYQIWFRVKPAESSGEVATSPRPSLVPIHVFAPDLTWDLKLHNGSLSEAAGVASARFTLRLRADPIGDLVSRGDVVTEQSVLLATHGGISGCLSVPLGWEDLVHLAIGCQLATDQIQQGKASPSLSAIVEVGRTYSLELAMDFNVEKRITVKPTSLEVSGRGERSDPAGPLANGNNMKWSRFVITVASDTAQLQRQIDELAVDLELHGHSYRTGQGIGQGIVEVSTGLPNFTADGSPADDQDRDGVTDSADSCPDSVPGTPIDEMGCSVEDFCTLHTLRSSCRDADWSGDGQRSRDCDWKGKECLPLY